MLRYRLTGLGYINFRYRDVLTEMTGTKTTENVLWIYFISKNSGKCFRGPKTHGWLHRGIRGVSSLLSPTSLANASSRVRLCCRLCLPCTVSLLNTVISLSQYCSVYGSSSVHPRLTF